MVVEHSARAHATLGGSSAARWVNCPGSIRLAERAPPPVESDYAAEGTAAHELAEMALRQNKSPAAWLGKKVNGFEVDREMAGAVAIYTNEVRKRADSASVELFIEYRVSLEILAPPSPMFGTADVILYDHATGRLTIVDLKYGRGVPVELIGNWQLPYYGVGAMLTFEHPVESVEFVIVQPRFDHPDGPVRSIVFDGLELFDYADKLLAAAHATEDPEAPIAAGSWCKFCPAMAICPAQRQLALTTAFEEFDGDDFSLRPVTEAEPEDLAWALARLPQIEEWVSAVREAAHRRIETGDTVPGWKLVPKRATRKWTDETQVQKALRDAGLKLGDIREVKLKSVAQIEKLMERDAFLETVGDLIDASSSGATLAPEDDKRPALNFVTAVDEFTTPE